MVVPFGSKWLMFCNAFNVEEEALKPKGSFSRLSRRIASVDKDDALHREARSRSNS